MTREWPGATSKATRPHPLYASCARCESMELLSLLLLPISVFNLVIGLLASYKTTPLLHKLSASLELSMLSICCTFAIVTGLHNFHSSLISLLGMLATSFAKLVNTLFAYGDVHVVTVYTCAYRTVIFCYNIWETCCRKSCIPISAMSCMLYCVSSGKCSLSVDFFVGLA